MEAVLTWVKSGLLFGIMASVILMLAPNKSYAKHISTVVGLLFILVMLHPVMELFHLDRDTYASYIKNFLAIEDSDADCTYNNIEFYEETINYQLEASLRENGYSVKKVSVSADENGNIGRVNMLFTSEMRETEKLELYLKNMFGEEVRISYELE